MASEDAYQPALSALKKALGERPMPTVAVMLGSGLGGFVEALTEPLILPYSEIPGCPASTVSGHAGRLVVGELGGQPIAVLQGRFHLYEGYAASEVVFPIRLLGLAGVKSFAITNAAGGVDPEFSPGELMLITDHLNLSGQNPLLGPNEERFGPRFPDMSEAYSRRLLNLAREVASEHGIALREGVYSVLGGPSYETPAEVRMLRLLGAHAVGMSTVFEVIAAQHMGCEVLGVSLISNHAAGITPEPLSHDEVIQVGQQAAGRLIKLMSGNVGAMAQSAAQGQADG